MRPAAEAEDDELVARAQRGDGRAFAELAVRFAPDIRRILRTVLRDDDTEDLEQEVLVALFRGLRHFSGRASFSTYLYRLCKNKAVDALRARDRRRRLRTLMFSEAASSGGSRQEDDPATAALRREDALACAAALKKLKGEERALLLLKDVEGLGIDELAVIFGLPPGTVKSRLHRLRDRVVSIMEEAYGS